MDCLLLWIVLGIAWCVMGWISFLGTLKMINIYDQTTTFNKDDIGFSIFVSFFGLSVTIVFIFILCKYIFLDQIMDNFVNFINKKLKMRK